ncbi:MAG: VOC family protein [Chloroflexi bacterium]|nr:VOC family protein [Chloroflexota bacterium]
MDKATTTPVITEMNWWEIPVPDLDDAKRFYGEVFGWTFQPFGEDYFAALGPDGDMLGGIFKAPAHELGNGVRITFKTHELEVALERVSSAGGTVVTQRSEIGGDMGWWAAFTDPAGRWIGFSTDRPADG